MASKTALLGKSSDAAYRSVKRLVIGAGAISAVIGVESVKAAANFQTALTRIHTQADATWATVGKLRTGILGMSAAVATAPTQLAAAAFHIASVGQNSLTAAQQLQILKISAEGAKLGGADLVDVTNALDAAVVSGIHGVKNYSQAMGVLNATVGAGDMQMQDLADAFGPLAAVLKGYNINIRQVGAALATFGDNNLRGAEAGTALRMAVQSLAVPVKAGREQLKAWGIQSGNLANQLRHGGLTEALDTLESVMAKNGVTGREVGDVLTQTFGKRAGIGLAVLIGELDRYHNKLGEVSKGAGGFASSWAGYTKTFQFNFDRMRTALETLAINIGTKLLPSVTKLVNYITAHVVPAFSSIFHWMDRNSGTVKTLAKLILVSVAAWKAYVLWTKAAALANRIFGVSVATTAAETGAMTAGLLAATRAGYGWLAIGSKLSMIGPAAVSTQSDMRRPSTSQVDEYWKKQYEGIAATAAGLAQLKHAYADQTAEIAKSTGATQAGWVAQRSLLATVLQEHGVLMSAASGWATLAASIGLAGQALVAFQNAQGYGTGSASPFRDPGHPGYSAPAKHHRSKFLLPGGAGIPIVGGVGGASATKAAASALHLTAKSLINAISSGLLHGWQGFALTVEDGLSSGTRHLLNALEKQFKAVTDGMAKLVKDARTKLANDLKAQTQFVQQMMSDAALSNVPTTASGYTGQTTRLTNIGSFLGSQAQSYAAFAKALRRLAHTGLSKGLISQIANMGPTAGLQYAQQILANPGQIGQINAYQKQIQASAKAIGQSQYGSQIQADRRNLHRQTELQERMAKRLDHLAHDIAVQLEHRAGGGATITLNGKTVGLTPHEVQKLIAELERYKRRMGKG